MADECTYFAWEGSVVCLHTYMNILTHLEQNMYSVAKLHFAIHFILSPLATMTFEHTVIQTIHQITNYYNDGILSTGVLQCIN